MSVVDMSVGTLPPQSEIAAAEALLELRGLTVLEPRELSNNAALSDKVMEKEVTLFMSALIVQKKIDSCAYCKDIVKTTCEMGTQTEAEYQFPEIRQLESILIEQCEKIKTLEEKLKILSADISSPPCKKIKRNSRESSTSSEDIDDNLPVTQTLSHKCNSSNVEKYLTLPKNKFNCKTTKNKQNENGELVPIGEGKAFVPSRLLQYMDWSSYTNVTRKLLRAVFSRRVLATHSLTGKQSPAFPNKPAKKKLDPALVNDIVQTVVDNCGVRESIVRTSITTKCADESKMYRRRMRPNKHQKSAKLNQENMSPSVHKLEVPGASCVSNSFIKNIDILQCVGPLKERKDRL